MADAVGESLGLRTIREPGRPLVALAMDIGRPRLSHDVSVRFAKSRSFGLRTASCFSVPVMRGPYRLLPPAFRAAEPRLEPMGLLIEVFSESRPFENFVVASATDPFSKVVTPNRRVKTSVVYTAIRLSAARKSISSISFFLARAAIRAASFATHATSLMGRPDSLDAMCPRFGRVPRSAIMLFKAASTSSALGYPTSTLRSKRPLTKDRWIKCVPPAGNFRGASRRSTPAVERRSDPRDVQVLQRFSRRRSGFTIHDRRRCVCRRTGRGVRPSL